MILLKTEALNIGETYKEGLKLQSKPLVPFLTIAYIVACIKNVIEVFIPADLAAQLHFDPNHGDLCGSSGGGETQCSHGHYK